MTCLDEISRIFRLHKHFRFSCRLFPKKKDPLEGSSSYSEQDNLLCTLPRTTLPKLAPRVTQPADFCPSMQVTVNPYSSFSGSGGMMTATPPPTNCDTDSESQYASVVYASPTAQRRAFNNRPPNYRSHLSPQVSRVPASTMMRAPPSINGSPLHRSQMSSTTTLSTCLSPRSIRSDYPIPNYDPNLHHVYCEIPLPCKPPPRPLLKGKMRGSGAGASSLTDETEMYGEDTTQCDLRYISDLSDDDNDQLSCSSPKHFPGRTGPRNSHLLGSPSKGKQRQRRQGGGPGQFQPPPLSLAALAASSKEVTTGATPNTTDFTQLPATDV